MMADRCYGPYTQWRWRFHLLLCFADGAWQEQVWEAWASEPGWAYEYIRPHIDSQAPAHRFSIGKSEDRVPGMERRVTIDDPDPEPRQGMPGVDEYPYREVERKP